MKVGLMPLFFFMLIAGASGWAIMPRLSMGESVASCVPSEPPPQDGEEDGDEEDQSPRKPTT